MKPRSKNKLASMKILPDSVQNILDDLEDYHELQSFRRKREKGRESHVKFIRKNVSSLYAADPEILLLPVMTFDKYDGSNLPGQEAPAKELTQNWNLISKDILSPFGFKNVAVLRHQYHEQQEQKAYQPQKKKVTFDGVVIRGQKSERRGTNGDMNDKSSDASWSELLSDSFTARKHENHRVLMPQLGVKSTKEHKKCWSFEHKSKTIWDVFEEQEEREREQERQLIKKAAQARGAPRNVDMLLQKRIERSKMRPDDSLQLGKRSTYARRKSCECSECGGVSKLEQTTGHIVIPIARYNKSRLYGPGKTGNGLSPGTTPNSNMRRSSNNKPEAFFSQPGSAKGIMRNNSGQLSPFTRTETNVQLMPRRESAESRQNDESFQTDRDGIEIQKETSRGSFLFPPQPEESDRVGQKAGVARDSRYLMEIPQIKLMGIDEIAEGKSSIGTIQTIEKIEGALKGTDKQEPQAQGNLKAPEKGSLESVPNIAAQQKNESTKERSAKVLEPFRHPQQHQSVTERKKEPVLNSQSSDLKQQKHFLVKEKINLRLPISTMAAKNGFTASKSVSSRQLKQNKSQEPDAKTLENIAPPQHLSEQAHDQNLQAIPPLKQEKGTPKDGSDGFNTIGSFYNAAISPRPNLLKDTLRTKVPDSVSKRATPSHLGHNSPNFTPFTTRKTSHGLLTALQTPASRDPSNKDSEIKTIYIQQSQQIIRKMVHHKTPSTDLPNPVANLSKPFLLASSQSPKFHERKVSLPLLTSPRTPRLVSEEFFDKEGRMTPYKPQSTNTHRKLEPIRASENFIDQSQQALQSLKKILTTGENARILQEFSERQRSSSSKPSLINSNLLLLSPR